MAKLELVVLSGLSGAGKTTALAALEERGYEAIMDLPGELLPSLLELMRLHPQIYARTAVAVPIVAMEEVASFRNDPDVSLLSIGLIASREELRRRYRLTRHLHPLEAKGKTLEECLELDHLAFTKARWNFDELIDTSSLTPHELKERIALLTDEAGPTMLFESFGYQYGIPLDADVVLDCRSIKNPYWKGELRSLTGLDAPVSSYIESDPRTERFARLILELAEFTYQGALRGGRHLVVFALGCSGGQHRSVYFAGRAANEFKEGRTRLFHREEKRHGLYPGK